MTAMVLPGIVLIGQQGLLGQRLTSLAVYERDGRVRRAVDGFIGDCLAAYREQNASIHRELFEPLNSQLKLDDPIPVSFHRLADLRKKLNRPAALFIAQPKSGSFDIRYYALDESDTVKAFQDQTLEPIHGAVLSYLHSMIRGEAFRERLLDQRFYESCEHWPYGVVHFFHEPVYLADPVIPRAYVGMWETVDFATQSFLLPYLRGQHFAEKLRAENLDPQVFRWSIHTLVGDTVFDSAAGQESRPILDVRFAAFGPLFEQLTLRVDTITSRATAAAPAMNKQSVLVLSLATLWFIVAGLLLTRAALRDRWLARMHRDFVGRISHELKTPVAVSLNAVESLRNPKLATPANQATFIDMLYSQLRSLTALLDRLIDVSRLSEGTIPIAPRPMNVADQLRERLPRLCESIGLDASRVSYQSNGATNDTTAEVDSIAFELIMRNLLENAVKYAGASDTNSPPIELSCSTEPQSVTVSVRDHGPGIPRGEHRRVFRPFYRVSDGLRMDTPGHGLGLSLVRSLVEAHRGQVTVSNATGGGCQFLIRFPRVPKS